MNVFKAGFSVTLIDDNVGGEICIEKGNAVDPAYDWLFDDPMPNFTKKCWPVRVACKGCIPAAFTNCPSQLTTQHDIPFTYDFDAADPDGDSVTYGIYSGPGTINPTTGEWTWNPPCDSIGKTIHLSVCVRSGYYACPNGYECTIDLNVEGTCLPGDANGNDTYNALDITYLINFLYKSGPAPIFHAIMSGDADCNCVINLLDITYLINNLYKHGSLPCDINAWHINCP